MPRLAGCLWLAAILWMGATENAQIPNPLALFSEAGNSWPALPCRMFPGVSPAKSDGKFIYSPSGSDLVVWNDVSCSSSAATAELRVTRTFQAGQRPMALEALRREPVAKGGLGSDWHKVVTRGLSAEEVAWNDGETQGEAVLDIARACMTKDALVEYECYNDQRRPQGRAVMVLRDWEDYAKGILVADHLKASDPYYEWYGNEKLKNGGGVYHLCDLCGSKLKDCPMRLSRADRREMVHVQRWRMVNPLIMAENEYMKPLAVELVRDWVHGFVPAERVPEPAVGRAPGPPGGGGGDHTGLDRAAEEARKGGAGEELAVEGQMGVRNQREMVTLGTGVDLLLAGKLPVGRFDDPEIESSGNVSRRPVMADRRTSGVDTPHGRQPHGGARKAQSSARVSAEEKSRADETGEVRGQAKRDPERSRRKRREANRRAEAGERSSGSRRRRKRKREEAKAVLEEGQEGKRQRRDKEAAGSKPHSPEASYEQEPFETTAVTPDAGDLLETMKAWLKSEECGGLSIAQNGALLALVINRSGTPLSKYLERLAGPGSDDGGEGYGRLESSADLQGLGKEKAAREMRRIGLLVWHGLVVTFLNFLWSGGAPQSRMPPAEPSQGQKMAQNRLWETVKDFVDDTSEVKEKVPRSPEMGEWGTKLGDVRISYHGEVVEKAQKLTLDQILPGLPPAGFGGSVRLVELCDGELRERLEDALGNLLPEEELPEDLPSPKIHASPEQWVIVQELHKRGLVVPVEDPVQVRGKMLLNGAFGVPKPGKYLLRFIMDFRCTNAATRILTGDVGTLSGAAALQHVVLPEGHVVRLSADDLVAAFYLFGLPQEWSRMMCFRETVPWSVLGVEKPGRVHVGAAAPPMGWASAVGVLQHAHRRLALRSSLAGGAGLIPALEVRRDAIFPDLGLSDSLWSLYLDDTSVLELMEKKVAESRGKALRGAAEAPAPAVLDGDKGLLKGATRRALETLSLGFWILRQETVPRKSLQVLLGREVHTMQFRRPLFGVFDYLWKEISEGEVMRNLSVKAVEEILLAGMCQALRVTNLRAKVSDLVTASDASESGGGIVYGGKLTSQGIKEMYLAEEEADDVTMEAGSLDEKQVTLVFDCFAGSGGLSRALQLARIKVDRLVVIEQDPACRRLNTVRWPGCDVWTDITKITKKDVERMMRSVPGLTLVIAGGGSPCQGLLYWSNVELEEHNSYTRAHYPLYDEVIFEEATEPLEKVADPGWHWPHGEVDEQLRLPTFTRAIPRRKPPPDPAGIRSCDEETLELWRRDEMKYPPYTYKEEYRFAPEGKMVGTRVASVGERERLMGFPTACTLAMHKHEPKSKEEELCQAVAREAALGNSFHAVTVACLMDLWLWTAQVRTDPIGATAIVEGWHAEMGKEKYESFGLLEVEGYKQLYSHEENNEEERLLSQEKSGRRAEWMRLCTHSKKGGKDPDFLGARLVHQFLRRTEFRGSDVCLDLGITYRPDSIQRCSVDPRRWVWKTAQAWRWRRKEHINLLELRAILRSLEWRARTTSFKSCRWLHLSDSQICLAVLTKGRSSSRKVNRLLRKIASLCIALDLFPLWGWIASRVNPADAPSRKYEQDHHMWRNQSREEAREAEAGKT
eukprot:s1270_g34.t1